MPGTSTCLFCAGFGRTPSERGSRRFRNKPTGSSGRYCVGTWADHKRNKGAQSGRSATSIGWHALRSFRQLVSQQRNQHNSAKQRPEFGGFPGLPLMRGRAGLTSLRAWDDRRHDADSMRHRLAGEGGGGRPHADALASASLHWYWLGQYARKRQSPSPSLQRYTQSLTTIIVTPS